MERYLKERNQPIDFYGRVVDQHGTAVPGAKVVYSIRYAPLVNTVKIGENFKHGVLETDANGYFSLEGESGEILTIKEINKDGYAYSKNINRSFSYYEKRFVGEKNKPVVFKARKRGTPTLVLTGGYSFHIKEKSSVLFDLLKISTTSPKKILLKQAGEKDWHPDLQMTWVEGDGTKVKYNLVFKVEDEDSGVIVSDEELFEAPSSNYKKEVLIPITSWEEFTKYLYVKGRGGQIYTKLSLRITPRRDLCDFSIGVATNPNGSRNLEYDRDIQYEYYKKKYNLKGESRQLER